jgi:uncharacterized protein
MEKLWKKISALILSNRILFLLAVAVLTIFMGYWASRVQLSYELAKILPKEDPDFQLYEGFKKRYGEDGSIMVIGVETNKMYQLNFFQDWYKLSKEIKQIDGIKDVVSNANLQEVIKNDSLKKFDFKSILTQIPQSQSEVDSVKNLIDRLPIYKGFIFSEEGNAHLMLITFDQKTINSKSRINVVKDIKKKAEEFAKQNAVPIHLSGMPYIRTEFTAQVSKELSLFLGLAILVTSLILLVFFRSIKVVFFALIVVIIGVLSTLGTIVMLDYKITLLSGLIPPLIIVIGVPNTIFILNKYHEEYALHGDKWKALHTAIEKMGKTLFLANLTTSIGFGVFAFTGSNLLVEFGIVSSFNVMLTFAISLIFIPIVFSYLNPPSEKSLSLLEGKRITAIVSKIEFWVHNRRTRIYWVIGGLVGISIVGMLQIKAIGYVVDDLPRDNPIFTDLKWVEKNFKGIMPFEVNIDAGAEGRATSPQVLNKIKRMEREFSKYPEFAKPLSIVTAAKFIYQAYRGGDPKYYVLPGIDELSKLREYNGSLSGKGTSFNSFIDKSMRYTRVSVQMADVGTVRTEEIADTLQAKIDTIFNWDAEQQKMLKVDEGGFDARITGNSVVFAKQNDYLQKNLIESTLEAIVLIAFIMWLLFANWRMIPIAILPSLIPLIITAGIMGFAGIALKPSTILIFSIAFGISSDGTIYFLTRYKDEIINNGRSIRDAVTETILNTGISMFYTAIILFSGFFIFTASTFKGTQALGILVSMTLLVAMICNLILLPAFLMTINKKKMKEMME